MFCKGFKTDTNGLGCHWVCQMQNFIVFLQSPIACKRCRFCGEEFKKKTDNYSYRTVKSPEPTVKRASELADVIVVFHLSPPGGTSHEHKEQREVDKDEVLLCEGELPGYTISF